MHEDEQVIGSYLVAPHLLCRAGVTAIPFRVGSTSSKGRQEIPRSSYTVRPPVIVINALAPSGSNAARSAAVWIPSFASLAADAPPMPHTSSTGTVGNNSDRTAADRKSQVEFIPFRN